MKRILLTIISLAMASTAWSAQTAVTQITATQDKIGTLKASVNTRLGVVESNRQDHETRVAAMETGKAGVDCFASEAAFNTCFPLDWSRGGVTYTAGSNITISPENVISATGTLSGTVNWNDVTYKPTETPISASMVTELFPGTGDCLGKNGQAVDCGGSGGGDVTVQSADPTSASAPGWYAATGSGDIFYKSSAGLFTIAGSYTSDPVTRTLIITSPSNGTITCSDSDLSAAINCGTGGSACSATTADNVSITGITATADSGYSLSAWTGDLSGTTNPTTLSMSANRSIGATFALEQTYEGGTCSGYVTCQNFEGTGYDNSETWYTTIGAGGSVDQDESVVVGRGSQSLEIVAGTASTNAYKYITAASEVHEHFMFRMSVLPNANNIIIASAKNTGGSSTLVLYMSTAGILKIDIGGTQASAASAISVDTWYHVWVDAVNGTGNATASLYVATDVDGVDTAKPETPVAAVTTGTSTVNFDRIFFFAGGGMTNYFDHIITKTTAISGVVQ